MHFTQTKRYVDYVSRLVAERDSLVEELSELARIKRGTRTDEQKARNSKVKGRLCTVATHLSKSESLWGFTGPDLFDLWAESRSNVHGAVWTPEQLRLNSRELANFEGRCEKAIRHMLNFPLEASLDDHDLPDGSDIKYVNAVGEPFRAGKSGKHLFGKLKREVIRAYPDETFSEEVWEGLDIGEVSASKVYYEWPEVLKTKLQQELAPEKVLARYTSIYLGTDTCFVRVPREDYAIAWSLACISQQSPKYRLRREYMEACLQEGI